MILGFRAAVNWPNWPFTWLPVASNLAVVLNAPIRNLALLFKAVAEKKGPEAPKA